MNQEKEKIKEKMRQVVCPSCGYRMPIFYTEDAECIGLRAACKARGCSIKFDIIIKNGKQIK